MLKRSFTSYIEDEATRNRRYLADEIDGGSEGGEPDAPAHAEDQSDSGESTLPDKFKGQSAEQIYKSYQELEKRLGERSPDYASRLENQITELREAILKKDTPEDKPDDVSVQQKEYLRSLGVPMMEDLERIKDQARRDYEFDRTLETLSGKYDGKDGRPKFDAREISQYAIEKNLSSLPPETIYKIKYEKELMDIAISQALKGNKAPSVPGTTKKPNAQSEPDTSSMSSQELEALARQKAMDRIKSLDSSI